jgi:hypothetical protein
MTIMRRLYFLVPDLGATRNIVTDLLVAHIEERHIHVLARRDTPLEDLPEAEFTQKTDFIPALEKGLGLGGAVGVLAGVVAVSFPPAGLVLGGAAVLATAVAGAGVGAVMSGLYGMNVGNSRIKQFDDAIEQGQLLMMVDVPKRRVDEINDLIKRTHPEAEIEGAEPTTPAFP